MGSTRSCLPENVEEIKRKMKRMLGGLANVLGKYLPFFKNAETCCQRSGFPRLMGG